MQCGLLGRKLAHSYSPQIHEQLGSYDYALYEKEPEELKDFLLHGDFSAINVTIPYKKDVIPYCSELSDRAKAMGSVNTLVRKPDGSLIGHNTDYFGFRSMVERTGLAFFGKKALVLGSGGAAVTAVAVLKELGAHVITVSRTGQNNYQNLDNHADAALIVNATPVGMYPNVGVSPVDLSMFPKLECVLDMIYNPSRTALLMQAENMGIHHANGLWMLVAQAKESAEWFTGCKISDDIIGMIHNMLRRQMENIILIGMPGSGKTTVGKLLAEKLQMNYVDTDDAIVQTAGCPIPEIFEKYGEERFRTIETEVIASLAKGSGTVIATGGGCVTQQRNYAHLHQNGQIFWLKRNLEQLPTDGRPLSQACKLADMYRIREPMYRSFSDHCINNNGTLEESVNAILSIIYGGEEP